MITRSKVLIIAAMTPIALWSGQSKSEEAVDFDELNGLLAYPEEYFSSPPLDTDAPSIYQNDYFDDRRGDVTRWESREGGGILSREVWKDDESGEGKARVGIGARF